MCFGIGGQGVHFAGERVYALRGPTEVETPAAYIKQSKAYDAYYLNDKKPPIKPGAPGVVVQYGDVYVYYFTGLDEKNKPDTRCLLFFEKPVIKGAKYIVAKPDPSYK